MSDGSSNETICGKETRGVQTGIAKRSAVKFCFNLALLLDGSFTPQ
jgi:hypothetical protein